MLRSNQKEVVIFDEEGARTTKIAGERDVMLAHDSNDWLQLE